MLRRPPDIPRVARVVPILVDIAFPELGLIFPTAALNGVLQVVRVSPPILHDSGWLK